MKFVKSLEGSDDFSFFPLISFEETIDIESSPKFISFEELSKNKIFGDKE